MISQTPFRTELRSALSAFVVIAAANACSASHGRASAPLRPDSTLIRNDIAYLASDPLEGRLTGSAGNDSAAAYIARRFKALGLRPIGSSYMLPFTARVMAFAHVGRPFELATQNVAALIPGRDPALNGQYVVIGAHFDHLGRDTTWANDRKAGAAIRNGADDNASGTAAVLELARLVAARPMK